MRLMLGAKDDPRLLVAVADNFDPNDFDFDVVNGGWDGHFFNGHITINRAPSGAYSSLNKNEIICDNQDRLRGKYDTVFENFHDENYVAPASKYIPLDDLDDDIPF